MSIYSGIGNSGTLVGTSSTTASSTFDLGNSVTWTFTGGLQVTDNATYTAVLDSNLNYRTNVGVNPNPAYPNGAATVDTSVVANTDLVFQGAFSDAAPIPFNLNIGNSVGNNTGGGSNVGQSFINDPLGTGSLIKLNTWTVSLASAFDQTTALSSVLSIYSGIGNSGTLVGTSSTTASSTFDLGNSVTWTFTGGLQVTDNATYTAVLDSNLNYRTNVGVNPNPAYPNGAATVDTSVVANTDLVFQGAFSDAAPIPFEFEPSFGILLLGGAWAGKRALTKFKARNK